MSLTTERREYVYNCDAFTYSYAPGDGAWRYLFEQFAAYGLADAYTYASSYEAGLNRGWDHANYCEAYGTEEGALTRATEDHLMSYGRSSRAAREGFRDGWGAGVQKFDCGLFTDGTYMDGRDDD